MNTASVIHSPEEHTAGSDHASHISWFPAEDDSTLFCTPGLAEERFVTSGSKSNQSCLRILDPPSFTPVIGTQ